MKNSKRIISFLLSLLMLFSTLAVGSVSSAAEYYEQEDNDTAKWKKVSPCTGYQIRLSKTKSFKSYTGATAGSSTTSKTFKSLKKGTTYYVKVRAYKTVGSKKYYSSWSSVKSIKCK